MSWNTINFNSSEDRKVARPQGPEEIPELTKVHRDHCEQPSQRAQGPHSGQQSLHVGKHFEFNDVTFIFTGKVLYFFIWLRP